MNGMGPSSEATGQRPDEAATDLPLHGLPRAARAVWQVAGAAVAGAVAAVVVSFLDGMSATYSVLLGWDVASLVYLAWVWRLSWHLDAERTAQVAVREDPTRWVTDLALLTAATASLAAVVYTIADARRFSGAGEALRVVLGVVSIVLSWFLVHTLFATRYAREYYTGPDGGIEFNTDRRPVWSDFAYLSFTIGMTFQVSDTALQTPTLRRIALRHMLISYLFGAVIIAVAINLVAGLKR